MENEYLEKCSTCAGSGRVSFGRPDRAEEERDDCGDCDARGWVDTAAGKELRQWLLRSGYRPSHRPNRADSGFGWT